MRQMDWSREMFYSNVLKEVFSQCKLGSKLNVCPLWYIISPQTFTYYNSKRIYLENKVLRVYFQTVSHFHNENLILPSSSFLAPGQPICYTHTYTLYFFHILYIYYLIMRIQLNFECVYRPSARWRTHGTGCEMRQTDLGASSRLYESWFFKDHQSRLHYQARRRLPEFTVAILIDATGISFFLHNASGAVRGLWG